MIPVLLGDDTASADLLVDRVAGVRTVAAAPLGHGLDLLEGLLLPNPGVGEDRVSTCGVKIPGEVVQLGAVGAE